MDIPFNFQNLGGARLEARLVSGRAFGRVAKSSLKALALIRVFFQTAPLRKLELAFNY